MPIVFAVGISYLAYIFVYFDCKLVNLLVYFYYSVLSILSYCTVLPCSVAQEFPSGLIKFYLSSFSIGGCALMYEC